MSNGSQIGGVVGAVVGGVIGFYTGNPLMGVQYGYAIGSGLGAYIDPVKTQGPRLEDASQQTSSVGMVIPFGYGTFTTMGNIIWADELKEHKKTERVGKGGGQKNTTFTYTRSYAIGVAKGPLSRYVWVKKNAKLVYADDPVGLGTAMGWSSKQISDLVAASAKFLQSHTLYYGTSDQMPDSTIVAVEGVGNVSPFRDLAYVVVENADLTAMQGAVDQYEFCVFRGSGRAYTTPPYTIIAEDAMDVVSEPRNGKAFERVADEADISSVAVGGTLSTTLQHLDGPIESMDVSSVTVGGTHDTVLHRYSMSPESTDVQSVTIGGTLDFALMRYENYDPEQLDISSTALGGTLT